MQRFSVSHNYGSRVVLSDFSNAAQGPTGFRPYGVILDTGDATSLLVTDRGNGGFPTAALFKVRLTDGLRTRLSDFGQTSPEGVAVDAAGTIYVVAPRRHWST